MLEQSEIKVTNSRVARATLSEDIIERGSTIDRHGTVGWSRDYLRKILLRHGNMTPDEALRLASEDISDIPEEDLTAAREILLSMIKDGCTVETAGFSGSEKNLMQRLIANIHGHNQQTTISA